MPDTKSSSMRRAARASPGNMPPSAKLRATWPAALRNRVVGAIMKGGEQPHRAGPRSTHDRTGLFKVSFEENIDWNLPELLGFMSPLVEKAAPLMVSPALAHSVQLSRERILSRRQG